LIGSTGTPLESRSLTASWCPGGTERSNTTKVHMYWRAEASQHHQHQGSETLRHSVKHNQSTSGDQMTPQGIPEMGRGRETHRTPRRCAAACNPCCPAPPGRSRGREGTVARGRCQPRRRRPRWRRGSASRLQGRSERLVSGGLVLVVVIWRRKTLAATRGGAGAAIRLPCKERELASNPASSTRNLQNLSTPAFAAKWSMLRPLTPIPRRKSMVFDSSTKNGRKGLRLNTHTQREREGALWITLDGAEVAGDGGPDGDLEGAGSHGGRRPSREEILRGSRGISARWFQTTDGGNGFMGTRVWGGRGRRRGGKWRETRGVSRGTVSTWPRGDDGTGECQVQKRKKTNQKPTRSHQ
jgi:hypothetical protein